MAVGMGQLLVFSGHANWQGGIEFSNSHSSMWYRDLVGGPDLISELSAFCENYRPHSSHDYNGAPGRVWFETLDSLGISLGMIRALARKNESIAYLLPGASPKIHRTTFNYIDRVT